MSVGKLIDTVVHESFKHAGETVECLQHVQDLKAIGNSQYQNTCTSPSFAKGKVLLKMSQNVISQNVI